MNIVANSRLFFIGGLLTGLGIGSLATAILIYSSEVKIHSENIQKCEAELPRNQVCKLVAVPVESE